MGVTYCLSTLKSTTKLLSKTSVKISKLTEQRLAAFNHLQPKGKKLPTLPFLHDEPIRLNTLIADVNTAIVLVQKYQIVAAGLPLHSQGTDMFSSTPDDEEDGVIRAFTFKTAGATGLVPIMENTTGDEEITDEEIFTTYRAIGCQSLTEFETAVHRIADRVADDVWEFAAVLEMSEMQEIDEEQQEAEGDGEVEEPEIKEEQKVRKKSSKQPKITDDFKVSKRRKVKKESKIKQEDEY